MEFIDGKKLQKNFLNEIKKTVELLEIKPTLAIISIGENKINDIFYNEKIKMCKYVGYNFLKYHYEDISMDYLLRLIDTLNNDSNVHAIMIELPILEHLDYFTIRNSISPAKDIECITDYNRIKILNNEAVFISPTVLGILRTFESYNINTNSQNVVIINRSEMIGKAFIPYFLKQNCTISICHRGTKDLTNYLKNADIVISATGKAKFLKSKDFKKDSIVIDIGMSIVDEKIVGDIDFADKNSKIKYAMKAIGGTGSMTIAAIAENILKSYYLTAKNKPHE